MALMKRLISNFIFILLLSIVTAAAGAEAPQNTPGSWEFFSSSQTSLLPPFNGDMSGTSQPASSKPPSVLFKLGKERLTVKGDYIEKPGGEFNPLSTAPQKQGEVKALATSSIIDRLLTAEGELAYNSGSVEPSLGIGDERHRLLRFGLKGGWSDLSYGLEYRSVGKDFKHLAGPKVAADQEGGELWAEKQFGILSLQGSVSQLTDNVADDPTRPSTTRTQGGPTLNVALPSWPMLSFFHSGGALTTSGEHAGIEPQKGWVNSFGASLYYQASHWDMTLASTYSLSDITSRGSSIASSRVQTGTPLFSLGVNYRPSSLPVQLSTFGSYTGTKASDGYTDSSTFNLSTSLDWTLGESRTGKKTLSLGGTFNRYLDTIDPRSSNMDASVWLRLKIARF
jgi:hypothetical protein